MAWGWQKGLGRGLMQFGETLNRGMQADIRARREDEIARRREASIERRWRAQEARADKQGARADERLKLQQERWAKQDERQASQDARQLERDKVSDAQFNRQMDLRESSVIEKNLNGIIAAKRDAEDKIIERYRKQMTDPITGQPLAGEQSQQMQMQMQEEIAQVRQQYSKLLNQKVRSYGERLRGTGFAYLLDIPEQQESTIVENNPVEPSAPDPRDNYVRGILDGKPAREKSLLDKAVGGGNNEYADPTFAAAFAKSLGGVRGNQTRDLKHEDLSPLEVGVTGIGYGLGSIPGLMADGFDWAYDHTVGPAYNYLTTKPSERK